MKNITTKNVSDLLYNMLSEITNSRKNKIEVILQTPTTESIFPTRVINTPLESVNKSKKAIPLRKTFQVSIEHWASKQRECMDMANDTDLKLQEKNFIRTNTSPITFDEITKKYRLITTYEVRYNAIYDAFEFIR